MMAVKSGAKHVYACEMSSFMMSLCQDVLEANDMSNQVYLIHSLSTDLSSFNERFF